MACRDWFVGIRTDLRKRLPHYLSDWTDIASQKVLSSTLFIFFTSIAPALTFSLYMTETTENALGAVEILLSTALTGIIFSVFGGQPLVVLGVTGPIAILTSSIHSLSRSWGLRFIPFYAWAQIWAGVIQLLLACSNSCSLLRHVTQFSCETFGALIALIYLYTGLEGVVAMLSPAGEFSLASGLLQFIVAVGTALLAQCLSHARHWRLFSEDTRSLIADYGATVSVLLWSAVPYLAQDRFATTDRVPKLFVPLHFATTSGRPWLVDLADIPAWGVFAAFFPGLIIALLFFFDHNVSSIIAQHRDHGLRKGTAFHWDYFVVGVCSVVTGVLGVPPTNSLIPQAPLHVKSVTVRRRVLVDGAPSAVFAVERVYEQRATNLLQSVLTGLAMLRPFCEALRAIPTAVLYGLFLFLGLQSFEDNEFCERVMLFFRDPALRVAAETTPSMARMLKDVPLRTILGFTLAQAALCALIYGITFTPAEVVFPVLIGLLVVVRQSVLPRFFSADDLALLDKEMLSAEEQWALSHPAGESYLLPQGDESSAKTTDQLVADEESDAALAVEMASAHRAM